MGPRLMSRGKLGRIRRSEEDTVASMGPQLMSRGKALVALAMDLGKELQWGRGS